MIEKIQRILTNHEQSSLEGLHQIIGGDIDELKSAIDKLLESEWLKLSRAEWRGQGYIVYKKNKKHEISSRNH